MEIHNVHEGYILDQFTISLYNKRTDEYGDDLLGHLKISIDIVKGIETTKKIIVLEEKVNSIIYSSDIMS